MRLASSIQWIYFVALLTAASLLRAANLPQGFIETHVGGYWPHGAVGVTFDETGVMYEWDRDGRVWIFDEDDERLPTPLIDIREEVGYWDDHGLLGFALHPDFRRNGYIYLLYVVDHHHVVHYGTPQYDPNANEYFGATIGRLTRYTARAADGFRSVDTGSRMVLLGETANSGIPITANLHGVGSLVFGTDGTLLVSCGEATLGSDGGSDPATYYAEALAEGILRPKENVGIFRSQLVDSLSGKILRLDPMTGDGLPSNPFFDPAAPRAARSRVWATGLRNPFRMTLRSETGSHNPADGRPGVLYVGDVGYSTWEELSVITNGGMNLGWPIYEGFASTLSYNDLNPANHDALNPLFGFGGCTQQYFTFRDLLQEATLGMPSWPNPCDHAQQIPASIPKALHARAVVDWMHGMTRARVGTFNGTNASVVQLGSAGAPVAGQSFDGECTVGGVWYKGSDFPQQYRDTFFFADFASGWIRNFVFDAENRPVAVRTFATGAAGVVGLASHPTRGELYVINVYEGVYRISYGGNAPPKAVLSADPIFGPAPLTVQFTGAASSDPEGLPVSYEWRFGDGSPPDTRASPVHVFDAPARVPTRFDVTLIVTDSDGATNVARGVISVNNTPPDISILSPVDGSLYSVVANSTYDLIASVSDHEHTTNELSPLWQTTLHHNSHVHLSAPDTNWTSSTILSPTPCDADTYHYRVSLTVTDAAGLSTTKYVQLNPECDVLQHRILSISLPSSQLRRVKAAVSVGYAYTLEGSQNLSAWSPIVTNKAGSSTIEMDDATSNDGAYRFYRIVRQ